LQQLANCNPIAASAALCRMVSSSQLTVIEPVELPAAFTAQWAMELGLRLDAATRQRVPLKQVLPPETAEALFAAATKLLIEEPTLLEVSRRAWFLLVAGVTGDVQTEPCRIKLESRLLIAGCCLQITPTSATATVTVVGDTHGQLHDVIGPL
jgi:hypothetical protein